MGRQKYWAQQILCTKKFRVQNNRVTKIPTKIINVVTSKQDRDLKFVTHWNNLIKIT